MGGPSAVPCAPSFSPPAAALRWLCLCPQSLCQGGYSKLISGLHAMQPLVQACHNFAQGLGIRFLFQLCCEHCTPRFGWLLRLAVAPCCSFNSAGHCYRTFWRCSHLHWLLLHWPLSTQDRGQCFQWYAASQRRSAYLIQGPLKQGWHCALGRDGGRKGSAQRIHCGRTCLIACFSCSS